MAPLVTAPPDDPLTGALDRAARELRAAVIAAEHAVAEQAVGRYFEALRQVWETLPEQKRTTSALPARARELLGWARQMTIIQRTLAADQIRVLHKASRYHGPAMPGRGLQVRG